MVAAMIPTNHSSVGRRSLAATRNRRSAECFTTWEDKTMAHYRICAWATDDTLVVAETLAEARREAARLLHTTDPIAAGTHGLPAGAIEGWHAAAREGCASVLIYEM